MAYLPRFWHVVGCWVVSWRLRSSSNPLVHDLYDILLLAGSAENDGLHHTRPVCEDTFVHRARHEWPPHLTDWPDWPQLWDVLDVPDNTRLPYHDARNEIAAVITRIANS